MRNAFFRFTAALLAVCALLFLASCKKEPTDPTFAPPDYSYSPSESASTTEETTTREGVPLSQGFTVDESWKENYAVRYTYFDADGGDEAEIREVKTDTAFEAAYPESGNAFYYETEGKNIRAYTLMPGENKYVSAVIKNKEMSSLSSTFMKLTSVDETFPYLSNVLFMREDEVAGRKALEYIQRAYKDGEATETVYIWIDAEFGFALKCEAFDAAQARTSAWEVLSFKTGGVRADDFTVDVDAYDFTEE